MLLISLLCIYIQVQSNLLSIPFCYFFRNYNWLCTCKVYATTTSSLFRCSGLLLSLINTSLGRITLPINPGIMSRFTKSNGVESDREHLLSQDTETDEGLYGNGTSINTVSQPQTAILDSKRPVIIDQNGHLEKNKEYDVYLERWYVLAVYSLMAFLQCLAWNTWGPIEDTGKGTSCNLNSQYLQYSAPQLG